ncbi:MAG: FMN-binding protein [Gammaproteobacteria bacterium]|nr:FMN-binding protein [Gammaproteobacteria bacterium]
MSTTDTNPVDSVETSQQTNHSLTPKRASSLAMIITLGSVAMISGLLVVITWQLTLNPIRENQRIMIEKAIFQVIPGARSRQSYTITDKGLEKDLQKKGLQFYAVYNDQGQLLGVAAEAAAQGYADLVRLLYGYDHKCECIRGFSIIKMAETPGLGDKILTDNHFLANFDALDAQLNYDQSALKQAIVTVKHGSKNNPWEIDAISGATITSKAVGKAINQGAQKLLPRLQAVLPQLETKGEN